MGKDSALSSSSASTESQRDTEQPGKDYRMINDHQLEQSAVVANCVMNRERNLYGSNGYDTELGCDPLEFLDQVVQSHGRARWLDLCCGTGKALIEAAEICDAENLPVEIVGVDLVKMFFHQSSNRLTLIAASLSQWHPDDRFDLITSVHGLHYIGDKLGLICRARSWLTEHGRLVANFDTSSIRDPAGRAATRGVASALRDAGFQYSARKHLLQCEGGTQCDFPFEYLGADDQAGPNYTGQDAVHSYYRIVV